MEDKKRRADSLKGEIQEANYDGRINEKTTKSRNLEATRDQLSQEMKTLSLQMDSRAKLDLKRIELKNKDTQMQNT